MKIEAWYSENFEKELHGRYVALDHINPLLESYKNLFDISIVGASELGKDISIIKIGSGKKTILAWSQMHGNETTTTKAIFDLLKLFAQKEAFQEEISNFLKNNTLYVIPILNPDGAGLYTRKNGNLVDLNRDAQDLSQKESQVLMKIFNKIKPDLCLNLHGQRTIFGLESGKPAVISFLSPASNQERTVTSARETAMGLIVKMKNKLQEYIPGQIGRYDDSFNPNCFGDCFQMNDVPVILFEAGQSGEDYHREKSRFLVFIALVSLFNLVDNCPSDTSFVTYFSIPENKKNYKDFILRNVKIKGDEELVSIAIQFSEELENGMVKFIPRVDEIRELNSYYGHKEIDGKNLQVIVNYQENIQIGDIVSSIVNKFDYSLIYFDENNLLF